MQIIKKKITSLYNLKTLFFQTRKHLKNTFKLAKFKYSPDQNSNPGAAPPVCVQSPKTTPQTAHNRHSKIND